MPTFRLGPSAAPRAWTVFVLSNACSTAVLSRIVTDVSTLFTLQPVTASIQRVGVPSWELSDVPR